jgi:hypothetical protein
MLKGRIKNVFKSIKERLPANGDWLYVTETSYDKTQLPNDIAAKYDTPDKVLKEIRSNGPDVIKLIYEQAKAYEAAIYDGGNQVREKAKALLSTAGFISAILLGVSAFLLSTVIALKIYIFIIEVFLFLLLSTHFIRSLSIALRVMTREEIVRASPSEFLSFPATTDTEELEDAMKLTIARIVAYANQTQEDIRRRANKLILGQHAFRYGLIYFVILIFFHITAMGLHGSSKRMDLRQSKFPIIENGLCLKDQELMNFGRNSGGCHVYKKKSRYGNSNTHNECHLNRRHNKR